MSRVFPAVQQKFTELLDYSKGLHLRVLRTAVVAYRDFPDANESDSDSRSEYLPFCEGMNGLTLASQFVGSLKASCGADHTEDVKGGLELAASLDWWSSMRVLIHIADCPAHGQRYHDLGSDPTADRFYHNDSETDCNSVLAELVSQRIHYYFIQLNPSTEKMTAEFARRFAGRVFQVIPFDLKNGELWKVIQQCMKSSCRIDFLPQSNVQQRP